MHLLWMGSISLEEILQLRTNLVVYEKFDIIILSACWAPSVRLSASSKIIIFVISFGRLSCFWAKVLIWSLTTSIPLSSDAFNYLTAFLYYSPSSSFTIHSTLEVFPVPGGPERMRWGMYPCWTQDLRVLRASLLPKTSLSFLGLYFYSQISFMARNYY